MEGNGILKSVDGSIYEGEFEDDKIHGKGVFTTADGTIFKGDWKNN